MIQALKVKKPEAEERFEAEDLGSLDNNSKGALTKLWESVED